MIIFGNKFKLKFINLDFDEENCSFVYNCKNFKYDEFYNFILLSEKSDDLYNSLNLFKNNSENLDEYFGAISENFEYMDISSNLFERKSIAQKIAYILMKDEWVRNHDYIKMKLNNHSKNDEIYYYLCILVYNLNNLSICKEYKKKEKKIILENSFLDFIYDYYN